MKIAITLKMAHQEQIKIAPDSLKSFRIVCKFNDHAHIAFSGGRITPEQREQLLAQIDSETEIRVDYLAGNQKEPLFQGVVTRLELEYDQGHAIYYFKVSGASCTWKMDTVARLQSFQNTEMTYQELFNTLAARYHQGGISSGIVTVAQKEVKIGDQKIIQFILQYQETDWMILRRRASRFYTGLIPDITVNFPALTVGLPLSKESHSILAEKNILSVKKRIALSKQTAANFDPKSAPEEFVYYQLRTDTLLTVGEKVKLGNGVQPFYVYQVEVFLANSELHFEAIVTPKGGMRQKPLYNRNLAGVSLEGIVLDRGGAANDPVKDKLRLRLQGDVVTPPDQAYWFPMATPYSAGEQTGLYFLPEKDDTVRLYFPSQHESEAVVIGGVRAKERTSERLKQPSSKCLRSAEGKELSLAPTAVTISGKTEGLLIRFSQEKEQGVMIHSPGALNITATDNLRLQSEKKLNISAAKLIRLQCGTSRIVLNEGSSQKGLATDGITHIAGDKIAKKLDSAVQTSDSTPQRKKTTVGSYSEEFKLFVTTVYGEAEKGSEVAWKCIAFVIMNRAAMDEMSVTAVITKRKQFECYYANGYKGNYPFQEAKRYFAKKGPKSHPKIDRMIEVLTPIYNKNSSDITHGAINYYSPWAQKWLHDHKSADDYPYPPLWVHEKIYLNNMISGLKETDDFAFFKNKPK